MDLLSRYRNLTVLLLVIFAQLVLLAYQVKTNEDVRLIRVWAVTAVTPLARVVESVRSRTVRAVESYLLLRNLMDENRRLKEELGRIKIENQHMKAELATADRARALSAFQSKSPSKTIAARVIGAGTGANSKVVFVDRGSASGVMKGMAVVSPEGILGKVIAAYPTAAQVLLITDPTFAAGVISEKNRVRGTLKGQGHSSCKVDYVQNEEKVDAGEWFYTSGDDRVFPKGLPVGTVTVARPGNPFKEIYVVPSGLAGGLEEVLIVIEGVHQQIPDSQASSQATKLLPPPPAEQTAAGGPLWGGAGTEADRLREKYRAIGEAQKHKFGEGLPGSKPPNFNLDPTQVKPPAGPPGAKPGLGLAETPGAAAPGSAQPVKPKPESPAGALPPAVRPPASPQTKPESPGGAQPQSAKPAGSPQPVKPKPESPAGAQTPGARPSGSPQPKPESPGGAQPQAAKPPGSPPPVKPKPETPAGVRPPAAKPPGSAQPKPESPAGAQPPAAKPPGSPPEPPKSGGASPAGTRASAHPPGVLPPLPAGFLLGLIGHD